MSCTYIEKTLFLTLNNKMDSKKTLRTTTSIREFAHALVDKKCIAEPMFINEHAMRREIRRILRKTISRISEDPSSVDHHIVECTYDVQKVLVVLKEKYFNSWDDRALDPRVDEMDLDIQGLIEGLLKRKGVLPASY